MNIQAIGISDVIGRGISLSFSALNYRPRVLNDVNSHRSKHSTHSSNLLPSTSLQLSSSDSLKPDATKSSSEFQKIHTSLKTSSPPFNQSNTVGIIGGLSSLSTLIFLEKLMFWSSRDGDIIPFIVCSDPTLRQGFFKPTMGLATKHHYSSSHSNYFKCVFSEVDQTRVVENLHKQRIFLEEGGARCITMPCHLSHAWCGEISKGCKLPFLHIADCVAKELKEARFKPLEVGCGVKIGVIATDFILAAGFYQEKLQNEGFEVVVPEKETVERMIMPAINSLKRKDEEGARNLLRIAIQVLLVRAANAVIIASDELQGLLPYDDPLFKKCVDPMDSLVRSALRWAKSVKLHDINCRDT